MTRLGELAVGVALGCAGLTIARVDPTAPIAPAPGAPTTPPATAAPVGPQNRTLTDSAPRVIGPRFDDDTALPAHADPVASYTLSARLDPVSHRVTGRGTIRWRNATSAPASELYFHLYLNAFKNDRTLFLRAPFQAGRSGDHARSYGYLDVKRLGARELGDVDLWQGAERHTPGDPEDETDLRVPLPSPVAPGEALTLDVEWESTLPGIVERTGFAGSFHFVGQWFPKLARREADGTWVHFPFHPQSEFYADFGDYDVTLDVPDSFLVAATGSRVEERVEGGRRIVRQRQADVHDFAWAAWDGFRERRESIDGVDVHLYYPAGHEWNADRTLAALRFGLPFDSRAYGRYPYPVLSVVHPPAAAENAGGMEYPTLITSGGPWYSGWLFKNVEGVTLHELGHQWFYGLLASDEHAWPFLDEGLNTWAEGRVMRAAYGDESLTGAFGLAIASDQVRRTLAAQYGHDDVVASPAASFSSFRSIGALVYSRTGAILDTLGAVYGADALERAIGRYARRYRFEHPTPRQFVAAVREVMGDEAADTLQHALFERGVVDYSARSLSSVPMREPAGVFDGESGRETRVLDTEKKAERWVGRVLVYRAGTLSFPVDVDLWAEDGTRTRRHWDGRGNWTSIAYEGTSPLARAVVDPDRNISLDDDLTNNAASEGDAALPRARERISYAAELLLALLGP